MILATRCDLSLSPHELVRAKGQIAEIDQILEGRKGGTSTPPAKPTKKTAGTTGAKFQALKDVDTNQGEQSLEALLDESEASTPKPAGKDVFDPRQAWHLGMEDRSEDAKVFKTEGDDGTDYCD